DLIEPARPCRCSPPRLFPPSFVGRKVTIPSSIQAPIDKEPAMSDNDAEFELDEPDLEEPEDGRDGQPPEEGSQDDPETLAAHDPLRDHEAVLTETDSPTTVAGQAAEPTAEDDWTL